MFDTPAEAYDRYIGRYSGQLAAGLMAFAGVAPGQRALDVGCGPGGLAAALAERLGPGAVAAVDPAAPFVEACRRRVPGAEGRVMRYCRPDELAALWEDAGLDDLASGELRVSAAYEDYDALWAPLERGVGPAGAYVAALDGERREAFASSCAARSDRRRARSRCRRARGASPVMRPLTRSEARPVG